MILWKSKEKPWPSPHPGEPYFRGYFKAIDFTVGSDYITLTHENWNVDHKSKWHYGGDHTAFGIAWQFKFSFNRDYYDGTWTSIHFGPFFISWYR